MPLDWLIEGATSNASSRMLCKHPSLCVAAPGAARQLLALSAARAPDPAR